jgi:hypothetical protein
MQDSASGDRRGDSDKTMSIVLGVVGFDHEMDGLPLSTDHVTRIQLPERLSPADLSRMRTDFELLAAALRDYPAEMTNLLEAHFRKDIASSRKIAETIGLSEQSFKAQGGGIIWALVAGLVICDVLAGCLTLWAVEPSE